MTADEFRKMALEVPQAIESAHGGHPDFRLTGKVFASLGAPDASWGMVKLTPEEQRSFIQKAPGVFEPCRGAWGQRGYTNVRLGAAKKNVLRPVLEAAAKNVTAHAKKKRARSGGRGRLVGSAEPTAVINPPGRRRA